MGNFCKIVPAPVSDFSHRENLPRQTIFSTVVFRIICYGYEKFMDMKSEVLLKHLKTNSGSPTHTYQTLL
jgi:hypothetical protein